MKTPIICVALAIVLLCPFASAQWVQSNGPCAGPIPCFAVSGTNLFAGTTAGVFCSTNNGTSWTAASSGLPNDYIEVLEVSGTNLFAGTDFFGLWRRPLSEMITSVDQQRSELPCVFWLHQNHPNPFNPSTTIGFGVSGLAG